MKDSIKRIGALLLVLCMVLVILPLASLNVAAASAQPATYSKEYNSGERDVVCTTLNGTSASSYYTGNYTYDNLSDLSASMLKSSLATLMKSTHTYISSYDDCHYKADRTDCENGDGKVSLIYTSYSATMSQWNGWNREHVWPQSLGGNNTRGGGADLHHVRPSDAGVNSSRGNKKYGESGNNSSEKYGSNPAVGVLGGTYNSTYFEPLDNVKGDVARICLYVHVRWGSDWGASNITSVFQSVDILLEWCELDPVDTWEMGRNEVVQDIQGNRNVFIDYPEYAWMIFGREVPDDMVTPSGEASGGNAVVPERPTEAPTEKPTEAPTEAPTETPEETEPLIPGTSVEQTLSFANTSHRKSWSSASQVWANGALTLTNTKTGSSSAIVDASNPAKFYANSSVLIECANMTQIVFNCNTAGYATTLVNSLSGNSDITVSENGKVVTVVFKTAADSLSFTCSKQVRMDSLVASYVVPGESQETEAPTEKPTEKPTEAPTEAPTEKPTEKPTEAPTEAPTEKPTETQTEAPTEKPTETESESSGQETQTSATISFANTSQRTSITVHGGANGKQVWSSNGLTLTNTNNVADYSNPVRLYSGSTVKIAFKGMTKLIFVCSGSSYVSPLERSLTSLSGAKVSSNGTKVTVEFDSPVNEIEFQCAAQIRLSSLTAESAASDATETETESEKVTETEKETVTETESKTETPTETESEKVTETEKETVTETESKTEAPTETESEKVTETEKETVTETESKTETPTETESEKVTETEKETVTETESKTEAPTETESEKVTDTEIESGTEGESVIESDSEDIGKNESTEKSETENKPDSENESESTTSSEAGTVHKEPSTASGCNGVIGTGIAVISVSVLVGILSFRKKKDD